jgi:hypothetical protein
MQRTDQSGRNARGIARSVRACHETEGSMRQSVGTIRRFKTRNFVVIVDAIEEDQLDLSFDDTGEVRAGLESGKFIAFCARARVYLNGAELASDYLGGCIYESLDAFMDHKDCGRQNREYASKGERGRCGSYFHDMIRTVCKEARAEKAKLCRVHLRPIQPNSRA